MALMLCLLANWLPVASNQLFIPTVPSLLLVSILAGLTAAWVWRPLRLRLGWTMLHSLSCTAIGLGAAVLFLKEGAICLIIVSPIVYAGVLAGTLAGRAWFSPKRDRLNAFLVPVIGIVVLAEPTLRRPHTSVVTDELQIAATPDRVWPHVLAFGPIRESPRYWLFRLGLPYPTETVNSGNFTGADRACRFSGGAVFKEKVAQFEPKRLLTFDIVEMPRDPELLGHLDATRGEFELRDNGDGTTTLVGRTWYALHVRPACYFDWWTHEIFRAVHLRVMQNIKRLAEGEVQ